MSLCYDQYLDPTLPVVALVGCTELHSALTSLATPSNQLHARYLHLPEGTKELDYVSGSSEEHSSVVLKHNWLHKHTNLAAVVSLWFSWDNDTPIASLVTKIESFRSRCRPSCKIVVVLVQRSGDALTSSFGPLSSPVKDDDRLSALRKATELDSRSIFSLLQIEGEGTSARFDEQSARRVERSLLEHALHYYKDESRNNKKARQLGKSAPPNLVARHHFKRAYFSEVRRDSPNAAKHWQACGAALRELLRLVVSPSTEAERSPVSLGEVKRVAEFVNRKAIFAAFATQGAAEACDVFRRHIRLFRPLSHLSPLTGGGVPPSDSSLAAAGHVHWGWLCKQYRVRFAALCLSRTLAMHFPLLTIRSIPLAALCPAARRPSRAPSNPPPLPVQPPAPTPPSPVLAPPGSTLNTPSAVTTSKLPPRARSSGASAHNPSWPLSLQHPPAAPPSPPLQPASPRPLQPASPPPPRPRSPSRLLSSSTACLLRRSRPSWVLASTSQSRRTLDW